LSPYRAHLVQFHLDTDPAHGSRAGRVEHVVSGRAVRFAARAELGDFIAQVLQTLRAEVNATAAARDGGADHRR